MREIIIPVDPIIGLLNIVKERTMKTWEYTTKDVLSDEDIKQRSEDYKDVLSTIDFIISFLNEDAVETLESSINFSILDDWRKENE
tara:strand:+ start:567 stop:824 length:258 start_codon:yes stop_codon:yes gene_type:complete